MCASVAALLGLSCAALENGLARTPPMGWNSWNSFELNINEDLIRSMADAMVHTGMKDAGYQYVVVDAGWKNKTRDSSGKLVADPSKFPSGMKALADYVHSRGLKFGIYTDAGTEDCDGAGPGSAGFESLDAATFAEWGVDFVKEDWCKSDGLNARSAYTKMSEAILAIHRPMVFSVCEWGDNQPWLWAPAIANMWRTTGDNKDCWDCGQDTKRKPGGYPRGWTLILDDQRALQQYGGPGHWNDPDMLEVGRPGLSMEESRAHFSLWAILAAPLIAGNDLRSMHEQIAEILMNKEVIAVDQDPAGISGTRIKSDGLSEIWARPLSDGSFAVLFFNRGQSYTESRVTWRDLGWSADARPSVRDLWKHRQLGKIAHGFSASVPSHSVVMIRAFEGPMAH